MKIAISAVNQNEKSYLDPRFGRANYFYVFDSNTNNGDFISNAQNSNALYGAGIQTAQMIAAKGVEAVITGRVGPKAASVLEKEGIKIYLADRPEILIKDALELFHQGKLPLFSKESASPDEE